MIERRLATSFVTCVIAIASSGPLKAETLDLTAIINTAQEVPAPTSTSAAGFASLQFDDVSRELSWNIAWQDLTGPATGMHFHAPAGPGATSGVAVNIGNISGLASPSVGSTILSDEFAGQLLSGQSYVNIHTAENAPGETRGQVTSDNIRLSARLDTTQEIPSPTGVPANAGGSALLAFDPTSNTLGWNIEWQDLSGLATGMHFHGPAGLGDTAGVQLNIGNISGLTSPSIGSAVISDELESQLLDGQWYINIHTTQNAPGEIRGQVIPEPSSATLALLAVLLGFPRRIIWRTCAKF